MRKLERDITDEEDAAAAFDKTTADKVIDRALSALVRKYKVLSRSKKLASLDSADKQEIADLRKEQAVELDAAIDAKTPTPKL